MLRVAAALVAVGAAAASAAAPVSDFIAARERMVRDDIAAAGVTDPRVLESLRAVPRHEFVPAAQRAKAYLDMALPIGEAQTISGPLVVALMTEQLQPRPSDRVLEIGTGSGYQAAVLSRLVNTVYSIEIEKPLADRAARTLGRLGYDNVVTKQGDGFQGWAEHAPFDGIIVTCSPENVPQPLLDQLADGGRMVIPVGERFEQRLVRITRRGAELVRETIEPTLFVPMTGAAEESRRVQPDGSRPVIRNGGFEELLDGGPLPAAWYYGRQCEVLTDGAGEGSRALRLRNAEPGRPAQIFQGFAVDGGKVSRLRLRAKVQGHDVIAGRTPDERPCVAVRFLDAERRRSTTALVGPWSGDFEWIDVDERIEVPLWAREGSLMIGMAGATGTFDVDAVMLEGAAR